MGGGGALMAKSRFSDGLGGGAWPPDLPSPGSAYEKYGTNTQISSTVNIPKIKLFVTIQNLANTQIRLQSPKFIF